MARVRGPGRHVDGYPPAVDLGGGSFPDIATGHGAVWIAHATGAGGVDRVDPRTGTAIHHIPLPWATALTITADAVWALAVPPAPRSLNGPARLARIDPATNEVVGRRVVVGPDASSVTGTADAIWVTLQRSGRVLRVSPATSRIVARIRVGRGPIASVAGGSTLWVLNETDRTLTRIDSARNEAVGAALSLGKELEDIAMARDGLWVAGSDSTVTRIDPSTGVPRGLAVPVGTPRLALAADPAADGVWVASETDGSVQQIRAAASN
jgi:DNA-binding beta-propeller fold protein YncE